MNFEQMEYIKEIIQTKSISIAAQNLQVSQSAISQSILSLEKELGVQLFKRSRFGTTPTEEGKNIIQKALKIVEITEDIKDEARISSSSFKGELKIASIPSLMTFLPKSLSLFKKDFPHVKVTVLEMESKKILEHVKSHTMDIGFLTVKKSIVNSLQEQLEIKQLDYHADIKIIVPKDHSLAFQQLITVQELADYPIVMYTSQFWENFIVTFEKNYSNLNILFHTSNSEVIKKTVAEGLAIGLMSHFPLIDDPYVETGRIIPLRLSDYNFVSDLSYSCITSKKNVHYGIVKKFLEYIEPDF